jgi:hypothetical protein
MSRAGAIGSRLLIFYLFWSVFPLRKTKCLDSVANSSRTLSELVRVLRYLGTPLNFSAAAASELLAASN